jgi:predicted metalloprotease
LDDLQEGGNIEDRRGQSGGGGGGGFPIGGGGLGIGTVVVLGLLGWALGIDPSVLIGGAEMLNRQTQPQVQAPPSSQRTGRPQDEMGRFVDKVLHSTDVQWKNVFAKDGKTYRAPVLVLYNRVTRAACGGAAQSAMGPFYCPADQKVYLDTSFFDEIARRFRGCDVGSKSCQFSQAYVIAHEVGHHVQNLTGTMKKFDQAMQRQDSRGRNALSIRLELQADCYAGVWGYSAQRRGKLDPGDLEAGFRAAAAVGDDQIQKRTQGYVVPESFTHGTAEQRLRWFKTGLESGDMRKCDTFAAPG